MEMVSLDQIVAGPGARESDEGLQASIKVQGVLQALLLRPLPPGAPAGDGASVPAGGGSNLLQVVTGSRRRHAALALGLTAIPAEIRVLTDAEAAAARLAENVQRQDMHPVELWRGVRGLIQDHGMTFEAAAAALGLDDRLTRRLEMLGRLAPELLALCEIDMPGETPLRAIAAAPEKLQRDVARRKGLIVQTGDETYVQWHDVAAACRVERVFRAAAIFDIASNKIVWEEDLFAEPGSDEQFYTRNVEQFRKAQTEALNAQVAAKAGKQHRHRVAQMNGGREVALPKGFRVEYGADPERLKPRQVAFHALRPDGTILVRVAVDTEAKKVAAKQRTDRATAAAPDADADPDDQEDDGADAAEAETVKPPFTKQGMAYIAAHKTEALRKALAETPLTPTRVLTLFVLALAADNVAVRASEAGFFRPWDGLARRILADGGNLQALSDADVVQIAVTALGRVLEFKGPDASSLAPGSGVAAEWIGAAIDAAASFERFDTEAFLATATVAELKRVAADIGMRLSGSAKELRERLVGHAPTYRPEAATFGAPAPKPTAHDDA